MYRSNAIRLYDNGWQTIPARGKRVLLADWPLVGTHLQSRETIERMASEAYPDQNIGLPFGPACPAFAVDIDSEEHADTLESLAHQHLGPTPFVRIGRAPRSALFYGKVPCETYRTVRLRGLELFAAAGSQMIIYGEHPTTKTQYYWGEKEPLTHAAGFLPLATSAQVSAFLQEATTLLGPAHPTQSPLHPFGPQAKLTVQKTVSDLETRGLRGWEYGQAIMEYLSGMAPGNRDWRLTLAIASLVGRGFTDRQIHAVLEEPYVKRFANDGQDRDLKITRLLSRTRRRLGGDECRREQPA
jgi:hypothetical protein